MGWVKSEMSEESQKGQISSYKMHQSRVVMYNMETIVNITVLHIWK